MRGRWRLRRSFRFLCSLHRLQRHAMLRCQRLTLRRHRDSVVEQKLLRLRLVPSVWLVVCRPRRYLLLLPKCSLVRSGLRGCRLQPLHAIWREMADVCTEDLLMWGSIESVQRFKSIWRERAACGVRFPRDQVHLLRLYHGQVGLIVALVAIEDHIQIFAAGGTQLCVVMVVRAVLKVRRYRVPGTILVRVYSRLVIRVGPLHELPTISSVA